MKLQQRVETLEAQHNGDDTLANFDPVANAAAMMAELEAQIEARESMTEEEYKAYEREQLGRMRDLAQQ